MLPHHHCPQQRLNFIYFSICLMITLHFFFFFFFFFFLHYIHHVVMHMVCFLEAAVWSEEDTWGVIMLIIISGFVTIAAAAAWWSPLQILQFSLFLEALKWWWWWSSGGEHFFCQLCHLSIHASLDRTWVFCCEVQRSLGLCVFLLYIFCSRLALWVFKDLFLSR